MIDFGYGVYLKTIGSESLELLRSWRNDFHIRKWCRQNDLISEPDQKKWFDSMSSDQTVRMYLIVCSDEASAYVGVCGLTSIDLMNSRAEFSLYIAPYKTRKGMGEKGLRTLLAHAFMNLGLNSIWGESFEGNPALGLFDKIGFRREGIRRSFYFREGKFIDAHLVSLLHSEFRSGLVDGEIKEQVPG